MSAAPRGADRGLILGRELLRASRRPGTWALRVGAALFVAVFVMFGFSGAFSGRVEVDQLAEIGRGLFYLFLGLEVTLVLGLAPWLGASAMAEERDDHTLEILGLTPVSPSAVLFGKLASRMLFLASAAAASLPLLLVITSFGGSEPAHAVVALIGTAGMALLLAGVAGVGALCGLRPVGATALSMLWGILVFTVEPMVVTGLFSVRDAFWSSPAVAVGRGELPFLLSLVLWLPAAALLAWAAAPIFRIVISAGDIDDLLSPERAALDRLWGWGLGGVVVLGGTTAALTLFNGQLRRLPMGLRSVLGAGFHTATLAVLAVLILVFFLWLQSRANAASAVRRAEADVERPWRWRLPELSRGWLRGGPRGLVRNPVLWREAAVGASGSVLSRAALVMVLAVVAWGGLADRSLETAAAIGLFFGLPSAFVVGMVAAVAVVGEERRGGTFPVLLLSRLSPGRYALGVLWAAVWRVWWLAALCLFSFWLYWMGEVDRGSATAEVWLCEDQQLWLGYTWLRWLATVAWAAAFWSVHVVGCMLVAARVRPVGLGMPAAAAVVLGAWFFVLFAADNADWGRVLVQWLFPMAQDGWTNGDCGVSPQQLGSPLLLGGGSVLGLLVLHGRLRAWVLA